ncbi:hypothetical protein FWH30_02285 [Microgenomates group bacterium]|nr:hypothetical protein [Microgenomates group bacterium]
MLSVTHGLTGAYLGSLFPQAPYIYLPAAFILHFVEDAIPHWDFGTGMRSGKRHKLTTILLEIFELFLLAVIIFFLWQKSLPTSPSQIYWPVWLGAFSGILMDILEAPRNFLHQGLPSLGPISWIHKKVHTSTPHILWGAIPQLLIISAIIFLALHYPPNL